MITNERQYRITRKKAAGFARAIEEFDARLQESTTVHPMTVAGRAGGHGEPTGGSARRT